MKNVMNVMKRAWVIYKDLIGDHVAKLAQALKIAWAEFKKSAEEPEASIEEKLISSGYKVWEKNGYRRIYVNDFTKYSNFVQTDDVVSYGHKNIIVNGIDVWESCEKQREFNIFAKEFEANGDYRIKIWYDCIEKSWYSQGAKGHKYLESMVKAVIKHFNELKLSSKASEKIFSKMFKHYCWECGCGFNHKPADDGTCGEC